MASTKQLIGARLRSLREARGFTQEKLAEIMDINSKYLSSIERGKENPTLDMLLRFSDAFKVEMWELFDFKHEASQKELRDMLKRFASEVNEDKLKIAVKVLRAVAR